MPRCASNSARCGPTPLIMRTSVLRLIAILGCAFAAVKSIHFISFPLRTFLDAAAKRRIESRNPRFRWGLLWWPTRCVQTGRSVRIRTSEVEIRNAGLTHLLTKGEKDDGHSKGNR